MKVKVSLELDLSDTFLNINDAAEIAESLQNLSSLFAELKLNCLEKKMDLLAGRTEIDERMKQAMISSYEQEQKVFDTMLDNWKIEGTTEDGNTFEFCHTEPGYKEKFIVNGREEK